MPRIHPFSPTSVNPGRVHTPGAGPTQGPNPTHPKSLERIGPLAPLMGRGAPPAKEDDVRPRMEAPRGRDAGGGRSWLSSMRHVATKTTHAINHGFNRTGHAIGNGFNKAGHALHKFGQALNEPSAEPSWMRHMSDDDRAHYDYYGELPAESSHSRYSSPVRQEQPAVAPPWQQDERIETRRRPMTHAEQAEANEEARYHGHQPETTVEEFVRRPASPSISRPPSGTVHTRPMTPAEQAAAIDEARYYGHEPKTTVEEFVPHRQAESAPRRSTKDVLQANVSETVSRMNLARLDHAEPRDFTRFAEIVSRGTRYAAPMDQRIRNEPGLGAAMSERWRALREHLNGLRAQGNENVPSVEWLFQNRATRMMAFLVDGNGGGKLVRPTTHR
jgi:hypothetical protein